MLAHYRSCSLFRQLLIPMVTVGIIGIGAIIFSAFMLADSVTALGDLYTAGNTQLKTLQDIDKAIAVYRAQSLRHQASESAETMGVIADELAATRSKIDLALPSIFASSVETHQPAFQEGRRLQEAIPRYFTDIDEVIRLSTEFEKESAFDLLKRAEIEHLVVIQHAIRMLTRHAFEDLAMSRADLVQAANRNLGMTIMIGILGGAVLLGIAFYVSSRTSRRIGALLAWSQRIAEGDLTNIQANDGQDEVGQLADGMRNMVENLAQGQSALECAKTDAEAVAEELRLYANAFESSGEAMLITDRKNRIIAVNSAFSRQTGYALHEVLGKDPKLLSSGNTHRDVYAAMWQALRQEGYWQGELWDRKKTGETFPKWSSISAILGKNQEVAFYIASFSDISERKANEKRIDYLAHHDALTGLINRYSLESRLGQALLAARRETLGIAVMFIDLDRFKTINDTHGHHVGDQLLIEVADRLRDSVRDSDIIARLGGDEFVVVLTGMRSSMDVAPIAEMISRKLEQPYQVEHHQLHSTPSVGIAVFPEDGQDGQTLMKSADTAMYHAKESGRNNIQYFTAAMNAAAVERLTLENDLRQALHTGQLELHYQPQVVADSGRCYGMEALLHWHHPERGNVPPLSFIRIAEESSLIEELGEWILDQACRQIAAWRSMGIAAIRVAVNISARQLRSPDFVHSVARLLQRHNLKGSDLELEITESVAMENPERAIGQLQALRALDIRLAIDDFGTGYSSLSYLKRFPIQILKLDREFVRDIESDVNDAAISAATLALAHSLGLQVVAEGVETAGQRDFLLRHNCDFLQGFLYGRPLPSLAATTFIQGAKVQTPTPKHPPHPKAQSRLDSSPF